MKHTEKIFSRQKAVIIILAAICFACLLYFICYGLDAYKSRKDISRLAETLSSKPDSVGVAASNSAQDKNMSEAEKILPEFKELYMENSDIIGWLRIENTNIDYPVMFTPSDGEFYLHRNFKKEYEKRGLPFLDGGTNLFKSSNYLIYGHNMKDGTEFADLKQYRSKDFFTEHPIIHFSTIYEDGEYSVLAAFYSKVYLQNQKVFKYYQFNYPATAEQYMDYVSNVKKLSIYSTGVDAQYGEQLLTLSTCSSYTQDGRFAVVAKKIDK